ncbi:hypothetical protein T07_8309 [Trichinella nelsoni]|uniref:Uncharacterized protein n=1 Tax=Trichinella nelsoni TaxID=6336 RepID=A0A0V0SCQ4_9BILA|nr:hypothetical protein T07_8309 [Trichinella nelsoni]
MSIESKLIKFCAPKVLRWKIISIRLQQFTFGINFFEKQYIVGLKKFALKKWINFMTINIIIVIMGQSVSKNNRKPMNKAKTVLH